ncbi:MULTISPECIES: outer membrane lipoprotein chaperone LolA [Halomonadaceae]|uniref:outer membrane lipoprotein chaperone LolA n=1 Tax=Halomonadaceae TaxID=28256 RepID=UPI0015989690|nr:MULTISPECIES: outer membrane lipoprotein chaperone LolA [Halomonas]QJQ95727.1 outer membrane lipoprotein chaperone LolA [Halomonas sp. PA5]
MKLKTSLLALSLAATVPMTALANEGAQRLTQLLEPLQTYSASFDQRILDGSGQRLQEAGGQMWLSRPGKFRWEVNAPYQQIVVSNGHEVYLYDPDLEQVTVQPLDTRVTHTPALLLSGSASELTGSYEVAYQQQGAIETFTLTPRSPDTLFEELKMSFNNERLNALQMADSTGQLTAIEFDGIEFNPSIDESRFVFDIPDGTDVIRDSH